MNLLVWLLLAVGICFIYVLTVMVLFEIFLWIYSKEIGLKYTDIVTDDLPDHYQFCCIFFPIGLPVFIIWQSLYLVIFRSIDICTWIITTFKRYINK